MDAFSWPYMKIILVLASVSSLLMMPCDFSFDKIPPPHKIFPEIDLQNDLLKGNHGRNPISTDHAALSICNHIHYISIHDKDTMNR
ncbi:hypothetical protein NC652_011791 [Populus alba x Populus x berolinensis]|uniref:Uncharacterized protein n=1 Tax=Populus alba x Populus x berolinensis TaxID=444605 RepID=A0AAD6W6X7_9ROSI|nr:hypothetical protein NC652_011791 [Populus alba x Populus x berolinensis]KAJ7001580.1 hypothetical protein NC653_011861 [Populus alba x Populus x berolinensis]